MTNKDLISQYVDTGIGIPEYQFNKLSNNDKKTYLRKMEMSIDRNIDNIKYYYGELRELPERIQLKYVKQNGSAIQYIENPSEEVQLVAVKENGYAIKHIKNPSEEVQLAAVKQNGSAIQYIENPSEETQLEAVKENGYVIQYIENPSEEVQLVAVKQNGSVIQYIENPSEEVQLVAVKEDGSAIKHIKNPSEEVQLVAVKQNGRMLEVLPNASEAVQLAAIKNKPFTMIYINNPSENIQLTALRVATTDVRTEEASTTLLTLYPYISDKNKVKVVNYLLNNKYITYPFYEESNDGIKHLILNRIISDKISISYRFYELLPENKKLDYLKMEIGYANENKRGLGSWIIQEYKKLTGVELVRDKINKQYVKRDD